MEILDKDASKPRLGVNEDETTFIQRLPSSGSSTTTTSQDQTMVEGEQTSTVNHMMSLQETTTRSKPVLFSNEDYDGSSVSEVLEELVKLKNDFTKTLAEINAKLAKSNDMMAKIQKKLDDNQARSVTTTTNENKTQSNSPKGNGTSSSQRQAKATASNNNNNNSSSSSSNNNNSYNNEAMDDDNFVRQYKPANRRSITKKPSKPSNVNEDLDEIEKAIEEIELSDRYTDKSRSNRSNTKVKKDQR